MSASVLAFFEDWSGPPRQVLPAGCFVAFWQELGDILIIDLLDSLAVCTLVATSAGLRSCIRVPTESWLIPSEVTPIFRSNARISAKMACAGECRSSTPCGHVELPDVDLLRAVPQSMASKGPQCRTLTLDFSAAVAFIDQCNYVDNGTLSGDTWQSVVLKLRLPPQSLDKTLKTAKKLCPDLEVLNMWEVPPMSIMKKVRQEVTETQRDPLVFPVIEKIACFDKLRVLVFDSRCHPNFVSTISHRVFHRLVFELLPELPLEEVCMRTLLLEEERRGRDTAAPRRTGMPLKPFLQLRGLKRIRLAAIADWDSDAHTYEERSPDEPFLMDLSPATALEELDLHFLSSANGVSAPGGMFEEVQALSHTLRHFRISGLPSDDCKYLRPVLARRLALCKNLKSLELMDGVVQEDFLRELGASFATRSGPKFGGFMLRIPFVTYSLSSNSKSPTNGSAAISFSRANQPSTEAHQPPLDQVIQDISEYVTRNGGCFHVGCCQAEAPDLRIQYSDNQAGAADNRRLTQGMSSFGQGKEWRESGDAAEGRQQTQRIYGCSIFMTANYNPNAVHHGRGDHGGSHMYF